MLHNSILILTIGSVISFALAIIGYYVASNRNSRQIGNLMAERDQAIQAQKTESAQLAVYQEQLRIAEARAQELEIGEARIQEKLDSAKDMEQRLTADICDARNTSLELQSKIVHVTALQHEADKQANAAQVESHQQKETLNELRERLADSEALLRVAQESIDNLKQLHATEHSRATLFETSSNEVRMQLTEAKKSIIAHEQAKLELQSIINKLKDQLLTENGRVKSLEAAENEVRGHLSEYKQQLIEREHTLHDTQRRLNDLNSEHTELKTILSKREEHYQEQMTQLYDTKKSLTQEFENIANKIFEEKGKTFSQTSQNSIDGLLKPFRDQIDAFQKRINDVHDSSIQGNTQLNAEIKKVLDIGLQMSKEANNLTSALKGDSQQRGAWGEAQLGRTLEMSGLVEDTHYETQTTLKDVDGHARRTDYLIKLPDGKHIIIDSKVSLVAYDRAVSAESSEEYALAINEHIKAVRAHIDDLASKDYTNLIGVRSPSFVLMFMPIEPAYIEALKANKDLFEYGYKKGIVLVSHTTLIPILRTVSNLWMIERSNAEARELSDRAGEIYNKVCDVADRLNKLGGAFETTSKHYNATVTALVGKQGLYGKVERFTQLSTKITKALPALAPIHMDFETEKLGMAIEVLKEESGRSLMDSPSQPGQKAIGSELVETPVG
ncbi:MAG: DNA recombination protein RmuC [Leclercia adecarboxylata]|nr:DNA recombination protein RmuC [uncultured Leclercia sp.]MDU4841985.1 DNA recombination protein RmuC [Leclercia adecarboxylata]